MTATYPLARPSAFAANATNPLSTLDSDLVNLTDTLNGLGNGVSVIATATITTTSITNANITNAFLTNANIAAITANTAVFISPLGIGSGGTNATTFGNGAVVIITAGSMAGVAAGNSGIYLGSNGTSWGPTSFIAPNVTVLTSGSGTYSTPFGAVWLKIRMIGPGGSSSGSGTGAGSAATGNSTVFGTSFLTANAGGGGLVTGFVAVGGIASGGDLNIQGGPGSPAGGSSGDTPTAGAYSPFGGAGPGAAQNTASQGTAAIANTGSGAGAPAATAGIFAGGSGSAGGYLEKIIAPPAASYTYTIGVAGAVGTAGTSGVAGSLGGSGVIIVEAHYN